MMTDMNTFPHAPDGWTQAAARDKITAEGLVESADLWDAMRALQEFYSRHDSPSINARELHDALEERFHNRGGMKFLYELLPGGPVAQGCRLAGLEPPAGSADQSFGSVM
ncbi:MAG: TusE/DsrC/DsvC family sulfur relay protein [Gammaproteobacteria bacterium]|jgi:tRNA 2-thiouridine synthesizing protein E